MIYQTRNITIGGGTITHAVKALLIINGVVFLLQHVVDRSLFILFGLVPYLVWNEFYLWQPFTYQFLHGGLFHLLFNMLALWMFGCDLERRWGTAFFLKYYFVSVIGGGLLNTVFLPSQTVPSIGASAGIYGILLAYGMAYPHRTIYFYFLFPIKMKYFVMIIGGISLYSSLTASQTGIAHLAHLGGMVFGYLYLRWGYALGWINISIDRYLLARRKRRFKILDGKKDDDSKPTLH